MEWSVGAGLVKENVRAGPVLRARWLAAGAAALLAAALALLAAGERLPAPATRGAPPDTFIAEIAHEHLVNLTKIGPRVAGSYENEVVAVRVLLEALRGIQRGAAPHHRLELDVRGASGAFPLAFLDGMNNVYRDVQSVVARLSARGDPPLPPARRTALLINCHFDTVPDSPGASDDGAGCAVALETLRALAASRAPLPHDVLVLLNGAEENIMQASHGFVTRHPWARAARAFINLEACGAGGREVLFQAGPGLPWLLEVYARSVPRPFASSLAQELFESGLIPADTDFRVFRDFGNLSGVDLAWSANGYVYHTRLDTAERAPASALQRTGDNVLALARGVLASGRLGSAALDSGAPVFFDVLGLGVVLLGARAAAATALLLAAGVAAALHLHATAARDQLYISRSAWWWLVGGALARQARGAAAGVAAAAAVGLALHAWGARLSWYSAPGLLAALFAAPALAVSWLVGGGGAGEAGEAGGAGAVVRGWWRVRLAADAAAAGWALALLACVCGALRSGFVPALWAGGGALGALLAVGLRVGGARELALGAAAGVLPALQTGYVALDALAMFVPVTGRAGPGAHDASMGALVAALTLAAGSGLAAVAAGTRPRSPALVLLAVAAGAALLVAGGPLHAPYSARRPQRVMLFHTRRTDHVANTTENLFWMPALDPNSPGDIGKYVPELSGLAPTSAAECARWVYCGAPYYLPALGFIPRGHWAPARAPPRTELRAELARAGSRLSLVLRGPQHVVLVVAAARGVRVARYSAAGAGGGAPQEAARWGDRTTYFFTLHDAREPQPWNITIYFEHSLEQPPPHWADLSVAGHSLFGPHKEAPALQAVLAGLPPHAAPAATGWGVDLHLYRV